MNVSKASLIFRLASIGNEYEALMISNICTLIRLALYGLFKVTVITLFAAFALVILGILIYGSTYVPINWILYGTEPFAKFVINEGACAAFVWSMVILALVVEGTRKLYRVLSSRFRATVKKPRETGFFGVIFQYLKDRYSKICTRINIVE